MPLERHYSEVTNVYKKQYIKYVNFRSQSRGNTHVLLFAPVFLTCAMATVQNIWESEFEKAIKTGAILQQKTLDSP